MVYSVWNLWLQQYHLKITKTRTKPYTGSGKSHTAVSCSGTSRCCRSLEKHMGKIYAKSGISFKEKLFICNQSI